MPTASSRPDWPVRSWRCAILRCHARVPAIPSDRTVAAGQLSATLPYAISYADGKFEARLAGAKLALRDLALSREGASDSFRSDRSRRTALRHLAIRDLVCRRQVRGQTGRCEAGVARSCAVTRGCQRFLPIGP